jgi:E3 ubiquitin-protein ligase HUWE1
MLSLQDISSADVNNQGLIMDLEMGDDDQMMQAIAMSLDDSEPQKVAATSTEEPVRETSKTIDEFTYNALEQCLNLLDLMPDTVYRICDLLVTITKRNGNKWRDNMLKQLINEIGDIVHYLIMVAKMQDTAAGRYLALCDEANKVAGRIYLYTLFFESTFQEMRVPCAQIVEQYGILDMLVSLLVASEGPLTGSKNNKAVAVPVKDANGKETPGAAQPMQTPKWLAPLLLLIDRLEKVAVLTQRKQLMHKVTSRTWKWFDLSTGKWTPYSSVNNRIINDAYWAGEPTVRISCSRRKYLITFSCMTQVSPPSNQSILLSSLYISVCVCACVRVYISKQYGM